MQFALTCGAMIGGFAGLLFLSAGRFDLPFFWGWIGVMVGAMAIGYGFLDAGLRTERMRPGPGGIDRRLRRLAGPLFLLHLVAAGLDVGRLHLSDTVPPIAQTIGLLLLAACMGLALWAMSVNRFFSPVVRIQAERGHHVITAGPYRFIRHPGYLAAILMMPASGLALGSWGSILILVVPLGLIIRRAVLEDRFLHANLAGYTAYASRVRWRIAPLVW